MGTKTRSLEPTFVVHSFQGARSQVQLESRPLSRASSQSTEQGETKTTPSNGQLHVFSLSNRPKQSRASAPKTRNGCKECRYVYVNSLIRVFHSPPSSFLVIVPTLDEENTGLTWYRTCRRRHIKCDLARPHCVKCVKSNRICEGYLDSGLRLTPQRHSQVQITSRPAGGSSSGDGGQITVTAQRRTPDHRVLITPGYETALFQNQRQWDSFQSFIVNLEQGATVLKNHVAEMTPQYANHEIAIREICSGIGALGKAFHPVVGDKLVSAEYRAALEHYGHAVKAVFSVKATTYTLPYMVLTSMLFTTFEMMAGNPEAASKHHNHAVAMMDQFISLRLEEDGMPFEQLRLSELESALFDTLQRLDTHPWAQGFGPEGIRVTAQARNFPHGCRHRYKMEDMPSSLTNITEASRWWHLTQHAMMHSLHGLRSKSPNKPSDDPSNDAAIWKESANLLQTWHASFFPLLQTSRQQRDRNPHRWFQAMTLESLYVENLAAIYKRHRLDANVLPAVTPLYRDMISHALQLTRKEKLNGLETLVLENDLIRPMAFIVYKSRADPEIMDGVTGVLQELVGGVGMAESLLYVFGCREKKIPVIALERAWGWYFTSSGVSSGANCLEYLS
ncbi:C6 zinc finger domain-containing protein [Colletotrichum scovillei]|uniref:C6 zinc finger domain-containing protein n=1 Tax=Colletotrichum scovillei TaxID=1209932 RepID=A0A9P7RGW0_9PEZI|nr:C6 zinc finger domain-containing protein [Colletotrichum scovillei]KAG7076833.1 C6 zinc finger domain-containing protein [Colletotrichum scovillei]KAG7083971.1 C6 zinc finger domain-containing protein [Colletotrichum scovillei]